ncbi:cytochrome P450 [Streptomyces sp. NPDC001514]
MGRLHGESACPGPRPEGDPTSPVRPFAHPGFSGWYVTGHRETRTLLTDPRLTPARSAARPELREHCPDLFVGGRLGWPGSIAECDGATHARRRRQLGTALTPAVLLRLRRHCQETADQLVDAFAQRGAAELVGEYVMPLAVATTMEMLGVPARDRGRLAGEVTEPVSLQGIQAGMDRLRSYFGELVLSKRRDRDGHGDSGVDLLRRLSMTGDGAARPLDEEIQAAALLLVTAGCRTVPAVLAGSLRTLLSDGALLAHVTKRCEAGQLPDAAVIDELLRHTSAGEDTVVRFATQDVTVAGQRICSGDLVLLDLAEANRDPAVFDAPAELRPHRAPNPHLAFGQGLHNCLGAGLARMQIEVALGSLLGRCAGLRIAEGDSTVALRRHWNGSWPTRLEVTFVER